MIDVNGAGNRRSPAQKFHFRHVVVPNRDIWRSPRGEVSRLQQMIRHPSTEGSSLPLPNDSVKALQAAWLGIDPNKLTSHIEAENRCLVRLDTVLNPEALLPARSLYRISL